MTEMLSSVVWQALREDRTVSIEQDAGRLAVAIDGQIVACGFPTESFEYPAFGRRGVVEDDAEDLARALLQRADRYHKRKRMHRLTTGTHQAAHGEELPIDGGSA